MDVINTCRNVLKDILNFNMTNNMEHFDDDFLNFDL